MTEKTLSERIESLKFKYQLQAGIEPTLLLLPKRKDFVKWFADALIAAEGAENTGSAPEVFDALWNNRKEAFYCGLEIKLYDGDDLAVGHTMH